MDRTYITLNENWKFHYGEVPEGWYKGYDDSAWTSVTLPHDWSVHMPFEQTNSSGTGYLSGGIGWYRVRFSLPEAYKGKRVTKQPDIGTITWLRQLALRCRMTGLRANLAELDIKRWHWRTAFFG